MLGAKVEAGRGGKFLYSVPLYESDSKLNLVPVSGQAGPLYTCRGVRIQV